MAKRKGLDPRAYQWFRREKKEAFLRSLIGSVLEGECRACSLDDENDRELVLASVIAALLGDP